MFVRFMGLAGFIYGTDVVIPLSLSISWLKSLFFQSYLNLFLFCLLQLLQACSQKWNVVTSGLSKQLRAPNTGVIFHLGVCVRL
jgi:hypothetical protein